MYISAFSPWCISTSVIFLPQSWALLFHWQMLPPWLFCLFFFPTGSALSFSSAEISLIADDTLVPPRATCDWHIESLMFYCRCFPFSSFCPGHSVNNYILWSLFWGFLSDSSLEKVLSLIQVHDNAWEFFIAFFKCIKESL